MTGRDDSSDQPSGATLTETELQGLFGQLVRFFRFRHRTSKDQAPDLAQETIARGLQAQTRGDVRDPIRYFWAVARNVSHEHRRAVGQLSGSASLDDVADRGGSSAVQIEARVQLRELLAKLSEEDRLVFVEYHTGDRHALRRRLGVSEGALRVRIHRLRRAIDSAGLAGDAAAKR